MHINEETDWIDLVKPALAKKPKKIVDNSDKFPTPRGFQQKSLVSKNIHSGNSASSTSIFAKREEELQKDLLLKKAWELAYSPLKQIPMNAILAYMSGNSLQIFSIMTTLMLLVNPLKAITSTGSAFTPFKGTHPGTLWPAMGAYILFQLLLMGIGVYKLQRMGLLPTTTSDWLAWEVSKVFMDRSYGPSKTVL
ncbi:hypothetical protein POMI540_3396 [Schizosaccharomyces pombe]|uniref:ER membrane protein complex subunit 4 n=1 Tax=Schizosaccharomyces pombe (strain 972 / ATCC 24843) TaxID=284812 RepID=YQ13_SCHPO|nr:chaperone EMC4 [Schizosaccharomyces pombe]O94520.1 RecName: Full=ER membrane protein complex subunit 4 [Schizosaccharomyces pombe 972h-]CAA22824.1 ER membrane protein complex subunit 4 (predicted) [Schizosaccharomyces pombe]|eukprot:NP_588167.1 uncharacterized protein SPCC1281.03c [Schizosaccharomyces pombe]